MPDKSKSIEQALDGLDDQIVGIVGDFVRRRRKHYEEAATKFHQNLKKDAKRYAEMLADKKISQEDFEMLLKGRAAQLKIELLAEMSISKAKFEDIAGDVLKLTVKTLLLII
jgi:predicted GIY-YIG superfamily endonuclease